MSVGQQPTLDTFNNQLTSCAVQMRDLCEVVTDLNLQVGQLGTAGLEALGASSTDAQGIVSQWAVLATVAAVYYGTATQGTQFDFNNALAPVRAGL